MKQKLIEIRDSGTCITAIAIKTESDNLKEMQFLRRGGWGPNSVILIKCNGETIANYDPFEWNDRRTMFEAHRYIEQHFDELKDFDIVDVRCILGETDRVADSDIWQ